jgi:hypothetical protein
MKIIFNDATELQVQQVQQHGDYLRILTVSATPEQLRGIFEDPVKTKSMTVEERGQRGEPLEGYTTFYRTEEYTGQIYGVVMYKPDRTPEVQTEKAQAAVLVAQIQAQELTDEQAITVKAIYPEYDPNGVLYPSYYKVQHNGDLYKCLQEHTSQPGWEPGAAPSLWVLVETGEQAGTIEDPIPVPDTVTTAGMEYEYGKYYLEGETIYLCRRQGVEDPESMYGQKVTLTFPPSVMVGQYFEIAEE